MVPANLGGVTLAIGTREEIQRAAAEDPFVVAGVADYEILTVDPARVHEDLEELMKPPRGTEAGWDDAALIRLRTGDVSVLGERRPLRPVLQQAGQALLETAVADRERLARESVRELRERDWAGDEVLAWELTMALGDPADPTDFGLVQVLISGPVDLGDLVGALDGDPLQGDGAVDLKTGDVYHPGTLEYDRPAEMDEESDDFDPDRWLFFHPDSRDGYRDMVDFTTGLEDEAERLATGLWRALEGRGAFRRFRDVLHEAHPSYRARWHLFSTEREMGRARDWLASHGYRSDPARSRP